MAKTSSPLVSIGLPVYNGERYIEEAIRSVLEQTYDNIELIISDNDSIDSTEEICRNFASDDSRVRYNRMRSNVGAAANFNKVFELSNGVFFKWHSHDDYIADWYVDRCVGVLLEESNVSLCFPKTRAVDSSGATIANYDFDHRISSDLAHERFFDLVIGWHNCYYIFGLTRRNLLQRSPLIGSYASSDAVLISWLGLAGPFCEIDDYGFFARTHPGQSMRVYNKYDTSMRGMDSHGYTTWFDPSAVDRKIFPKWRVLSEYLRTVSEASISMPEKLRCTYPILRWAYRFRRQLWQELRLRP